MTESIISLKDISFAYESKPILEDVNLNIDRGAFMGLVGPNGGGKTTLIKIILGQLKADKGTVELFQQPLTHFKEWTRIGFVSQKANSFNKGFPATVFEVVSMGLTAKIGYFKFLKSKHKQKVLDAIDQVDMIEYAYENIGNLSGGQQQRIFIARALVNDPDLLILDEPTVGIDYKNVERFYNLLHQLNESRGITLLLVTHDTGAMTEHVTDIVCLNKHLHFHGDTKKYTALTEEDLSTIYGHPVHIVKHNH
ncbi:MAG TPA: metal ABC transporter ATP-binding protein [Candidatus Dormibacteraeota bacterium]|nr:metal ABC transporter ATP-binding protein [Candidatus Dormibacteraeota bacterium]